MAYWLIALFFLSSVFWMRHPPYGLRLAFNSIIIISIGKLAYSLLIGLDRLMDWLQYRGRASKKQGQSQSLSRRSFLRYLATATALFLSGLLFYGWRNRYNYKIHRLTLAFPELPTAFSGFKIVQISDIHSGSFTDKAAVERGIQKILALNPDIIFFTGDLVNNRTDEMRPYQDLFARIKAPYGVFSILGNHDYGDYERWDTKEEKENNLRQMKDLHKQMGWHLLCNEHVYIEKNGGRIGLIGVENWSATRRFSRYGDLKKAYKGIDKRVFKILLTHDPTHWDARVLAYKDIHLTLSGHTHGMQFGVEIPFFKWSPAQYFYPRWAGLYEEGLQKLYVNRGFGFLGYQGRVGILPEITFIELI